MAINVNTVYQTVLLILNKEQRGYITPVEFNKIGNQTQLEIFETYFDSLNQQLRVPQADTDYADRVVNLDEKISIFKEFGSAASISSTNVFDLPQQFSGSGSVLSMVTSPTLTVSSTTSTDNTAGGATTALVLVTPNANIVEGMTVTGGGLPAGVTIATVTNPQNFILSSTQNIPLNSTLTYSAGADGLTYAIGDNASGNTITTAESANGIFDVFANGILLPKSDYKISGLNLTFYSQPTTGETLLINYYPKQFYRLGGAFYTTGALPTQELERVTRSDLFHLNSSNLTKPSTTYPIYIYENNKLTLYPTTITSGIDVSYIRKPITPVWNFTIGNNSSYVYSATTSCDFELHPADQIELILKILLYSGVVIKNPEIIQTAAAQIQQENINQQR